MKDMTSFRSIQHTGRREGGATINETITPEFGKPPPQHDTGWRAIATKGAEFWRKMHAEKRGRTHKQDALIMENISRSSPSSGSRRIRRARRRYSRSSARCRHPRRHRAAGIRVRAVPAVFRIVDADHSAQMSATEMEQRLKFLGIECTYRLTQAIARTPRRRRTGVIEEDEFVQWLTGGHRKARGFARRAHPQGHRRRVGAPEEGVLIIEFERASTCRQSQHRSGTDISAEGLIKNIMHAPNDAERREVIDRAIENSEIYFTAKQAHMIMDACGGLGSRRLHHLTADLAAAEMCNLENTCQLLESTCTTLADQVRIAAKIRFSFFAVLIGNPTGFHKIDLSNEKPSIGHEVIAEFANDREDGKHRQSEATGDTSQKGNWKISGTSASTINP